MGVTVPPETFRIGARGRWLIVHIGTTPDDMRATMKQHVGWCDPNQMGCVVRVNGFAGEYADCLGYIFLPASHLGAGLVAHELGHAAFRVCEKTNAGPDEEIYCGVLETLTKDFWAKAYERGYA